MWRSGLLEGQIAQLEALLAGEVGAGKTSWLRAFVAQRPGAHRLDIPTEMYEPERLCRWLAEELGLEETATPPSVRGCPAARPGRRRPPPARRAARR